MASLHISKPAGPRDCLLARTLMFAVSYAVLRDIRFPPSQTTHSFSYLPSLYPSKALWHAVWPKEDSCSVLEETQKPCLHVKLLRFGDI